MEAGGDVVSQLVEGGAGVRNFGAPEGVNGGGRVSLFSGLASESAEVTLSPVQRDLCLAGGFLVTEFWCARFTGHSGSPFSNSVGLRNVSRVLTALPDVGRYAKQAFGKAL